MKIVNVDLYADPLMLADIDELDDVEYETTGPAADPELYRLRAWRRRLRAASARHECRRERNEEYLAKSDEVETIVAKGYLA
jgi:hypothetical protein